MSEDDVYRCPVCRKPFDTTDRLADFAIAAHEKNHRADRNSPRNLIRLSDSGYWQCMPCGHGLGRHEEAARLAVISHAREAHGSLPASSAPSVTRGGRSAGKGSRHGSGRLEGVADAVGDSLEAVGDAIGGAAGSVAEFLGNLLSGGD